MVDEIQRCTKEQRRQRQNELQRTQRCEASDRAEGPTGATGRPRPTNPLFCCNMDPLTPYSGYGRSDFRPPRGRVE